jgi:hypothetical protein
MRKIILLGLIGLGAVSLYAQEQTLPVSLGFKVGLPVTDMFSASNTTAFGNTTPGPYTSAVPWYVFGVTGEFHVYKNIRFEVDGLFRRGGFDTALPYANTGLLAYYPTTFDQWEIPGLFKTDVKLGRFRPFIDFGAALRHISDISQTVYAPGVLIPPINDNAQELHNRNSFGGVAGFGFTFKEGPVKLSPEARYTRWANESFMSTVPGLRTNLDQGEVLLGITF